MGERIRVGVIFGGKSAEHEVSLQSARNVIEAIDRDKYEVVLIGIDKSGRWYLCEEGSYLENPDDPRRIRLRTSGRQLAIALGGQAGQIIDMASGESIGRIDVVFPVLHGPFGEDGTIQGLFKLAEIPFVGASILGSAAGMDKDVTKRLLRDAGIPCARFVVVHRSTASQFKPAEIAAELGMPVFVKPANLGSSVGITKARSAAELARAMECAFEYDDKILIEEYIEGREIECSVLGNEDPVASVPGEIIPTHEFYSYEAKYIDENGAILEIPAKLPPGVVERVQKLAIAAFKALCCEGMARVDFFLRGKDELFVNELNTIPGFTKISMYPKLWEASGIPYPELIDRLITLAIERFDREKRLKTSVEL